MKKPTIAHKVAQYAIEKPDDPAIIFLRDGETDAVSITYVELDRRAKIIAASIRTKMPEAERALLLHPPGLEFVAALCGCFYAGVAAIPCYPPTVKLNSRANDRLLRLVDDARTNLALVDTSNVAKALAYLSKTPIRLMETNILKEETASDLPVVEGSDTAIIQYTSGSTGAPKGVVVSHANLMANLDSIQQAFELSENSCVVSWLPPYHDMGLMGGILSALSTGYVLIMMEARHFLQKPVRWLQAIDRYDADTSGAPGFAYDLCVDKIAPHDIAELDLSRWTLAFCGAETVRANSMQRFSETFAAAGFSKTALFPTYGLAEITLMASAQKKGKGAHVVAFDSNALERGYGEPACASAKSRDLTSCGKMGEGTSLYIVDPEHKTIWEEGRIGEIWLSGASVAQGYWEKDQLSHDVFDNYIGESQEKWLRTGDLGFLWQGELFVSGRLKDLLIIRGKNFYPGDLEEVIGCCHPALALNACAAFSIESGREEKLILAVEVRRDARLKLDVARIMQSIRGALSEIFELSAHDILLLRPNSLPRTTSGKISRTMCREEYLQHKWSLIQDVTDPKKPVHSVDKDALTSQVFECVARLLGVAEYTLDQTQTLGDLGIDSLKRVELSLILEDGLKSPLNPEMFDATLNLGQMVAQLRDIQAHRKDAIETTAKSSVDISGPLPLTALQHAFLNANLEEADQFVEVIYLRTPRGVDVKALQIVLNDLERRFDGLRLRFRCDQGQWRQAYSTQGNTLSFERLDVSGLTPAEIREKRTQMVSGLKSGLDLANGPLTKTVFFDRGAVETGILGLSIHHLVVDVVSMSVLVTTLEQSYGRVLAGTYETPASEPVFGPWLVQMATYADKIKKGEVLYWQKVCGYATEALCVENRDDQQKSASGRWKVTVPESLSLEETRLLFTHYPEANQRHDVFVAALAFVWCVLTKEDHALIALEHHGRRSFDDTPAPWAGLGWFVYRYPVRISAINNHMASAWVLATQDAIANTPHHGIGYGLLARVNSDETIRNAMDKLCRPRLKVTYRGNVDDGFRKGAKFSYIGREGDSSVYLKAMEKVGEHYDLELQVSQNKGHLELAIQYVSDALDEGLPNKMREQLVNFLRNLLREVAGE
jgi:acyl-CoA synthetase (AMP-forming)/AMP-acid ligase II/acyl carrier protein